MKRLVLMFIVFLICRISNAQLHTSADLSFMRSINHYDESEDPENSMSPLNANSLMGSIRVNYDIGKFFNAGLQLMIQKQNVDVTCNRGYFDENYKPHWLYDSFPFLPRPSSSYQPQSREILFDHYFMLGPEFNAQFPLGNSIKFQIGSSFLFYDNRQMTTVFERDLQQQSIRNYHAGNWTSTPYLYSSDAEFLNGWNMKINGSIRFLFMPIKNKAHTFSLSFSAGRSIKQNYAVIYRTNKYGSQTETNVVRVQNYGQYYGINVGYGYRFDLNRD